MIDRTSRDELAALLTRFADGLVPAEEFAERLPQSRDPAVPAVGTAAECFLYDTDIDDRGIAQLTGEQKEDIRRYILFLRTGQDYRWDQPMQLPNWTLLLLPLIIAVLVILLLALFGAASSLAEALARLGWHLDEFDGFLLLIVLAIAGVGVVSWLNGRRSGVDRRVWPFYRRRDYEDAKTMGLVEGHDR